MEAGADTALGRRCVWRDADGASAHSGRAIFVSGMSAERFPLPLHELGLAVNEVVHHDGVLRSVVVGAWNHIAAADSYARDSGVLERDTQERDATLPRRRRNEVAVEQLAIQAEQLDRGAATADSTRVPVGTIHVREDSAEAANRRSLIAASRYEEPRIGHVAADCTEESHRAERLKDRFVRGIGERFGEPGCRRLHEAVTGRHEQRAATEQETFERGRDDRRCGRAATVPVDFAMTVG